MAELLRPLPPGFATTREALHRVGEDLIKVAREHSTGEWTLMPTPGGFGTPVFGEDTQLRVDGDELVVRIRGDETRARITSLAAAAVPAKELLPLSFEPSDAPLEVDAHASRILGDWYAFGATLLARLAGEMEEGDAPTQPTLWPEHFDIAIEAGPEDLGRRANYGLSPGDENHDEPYLYVGPWTANPTGPLWNAAGFNGAELGYADLQAAEDQLETAMEFCQVRRQAINETEVAQSD
jgi:hypothetical protein